MSAVIRPLSPKQSALLGKLQDVERFLADATLWVAKARAQMDANPFDWDAIGASARAGSNAAGDLDRALYDMTTLCDELSTDAYEEAYERRERERARQAVRA